MITAGKILLYESLDLGNLLEAKVDKGLSTRAKKLIRQNRLALSEPGRQSVHRSSRGKKTTGSGTRPLSPRYPEFPGAPEEFVARLRASPDIDTSEQELLRKTRNKDMHQHRFALRAGRKAGKKARKGVK
jgi:hypothetical protein